MCLWYNLFRAAKYGVRTETDTTGGFCRTVSVFRVGLITQLLVHFVGERRSGSDEKSQASLSYTSIRSWLADH